MLEMSVDELISIKEESNCICLFDLLKIFLSLPIKYLSWHNISMTFNSK